MHKKIRLAICLVLCLGIIIGALINIIATPFNNEFFIFQDLSECEQLFPVGHSNVIVQRYDTPNGDKNLKGLPYVGFFGMTYQSNAYEYEIFAYEFENSDVALNYYINVTGRDGLQKKTPLRNNEDAFLSYSQGMFSFQIVVAYQNKAYQLRAPKQHEAKISTLLANTFSKKFP